MPPPAVMLVVATILPLASFVLLVFAGRRFGNPLAGWVATAAIGGSFFFSLAAMVAWYNGGHFPVGGEWGYGKLPISETMQWIPAGTADHPGGVAQEHSGWLDVGVYVDSLTITMFAMITLVATLVHIFSIGYMAEDKRFPRFFTYLGLFCFSMLGLVIGGTVLQLFIFWELVGLCSYLLIGFWYEKKSASNAAIKAFITNRVGDFGFLIGFGILVYHLGNVTLPKLWVALGDAGQGGAIQLPDGTVFTAGLLTIMGIGLFCGAIGKSAQFPLHVWLPDAMEGPTPVSALIHAATMVAAGVYLVGRIFPILTPDAKLFIAIIGCTTLTMAALIAVVQTDIKKILAYSTLSQLGYMILAMGIGSWVGGLFHLITHAFFKALLFLGSGSVIHAAHHEQEVTQYGGLWRKIPVTAATFGIAVLAIAGMGYGGVGFSGYYSKDMIVAHAGAFATYATETGPMAAIRSHACWLFFILPAVVAYVTAFYMTRCWTLTFGGKPRNKHLYDHAHESPIMWGPLALLALLSIIGGSWLNVKELLKSTINESRQVCEAEQKATPFYANKPFRGFATAWPTDPPKPEGPAAEGSAGEAAGGAHAAEGPAGKALEEGEHLVHKYIGFAWLIGIGLGVVLYWPGLTVARQIVRIPPLGWVHRWLYHRMYFDELYFFVFVGLTMLLSRLIAWFDKWVVDGAVNGVARGVKELSFGVGAHDRYVVDGAVNGMGKLAHGLGTAVRTPQTGRVRVYVTVLMVAVALGAAGAIVAILSR